MSKLIFFFLEAFIGMKRSFLMICISLATIFVSLFIFGVFLIINFNLSHLSSYLDSKLEIRVFLKESLTKKEVRHFSIKLKGLNGVKDVDMILKDAAWSELKSTYSSLKLGDLLDHNPLPHSLTVTLAEEVDVSKMAAIIKGFPLFVEDVIYGGHFALKMQSISRFILYFGWSLVTLLSCATFLIIFNTIKLTIMNRSEEITIMKLVGATDSFVMGPFLVEGGILGGLSSIFAIVLLYFTSKIVYFKISAVMPFFPYVFNSGMMVAVAIIIFLWGAFLSFIGAFVSTKATLKNIL